MRVIICLRILGDCWGNNMRELNLLTQWADSVVGQYNKSSITETAKNSKMVNEEYTDSVEELQAKLVALQRSGLKAAAAGVAKQLKKKLAQQNKSHPAKVAETDQPPQGSLYSPLSTVSRETPRRDAQASAQQRSENSALRKFMGHND